MQNLIDEAAVMNDFGFVKWWNWSDYWCEMCVFREQWEIGNIINFAIVDVVWMANHMATSSNLARCFYLCISLSFCSTKIGLSHSREVSELKIKPHSELDRFDFLNKDLNWFRFSRINFENIEFRILFDIEF